jgi:hypothetical protein
MNVKDYETGETVTCCVHTLVTTQTFSVPEMEFLLTHQKKYPLCSSCKAAFRRRIKDAKETQKRTG